MKIAIIIPTYNERENLENLVTRILGLGISNLEIIIVDDNSPDGTGEIADKLSSRLKNIKVIHRNRKLGLGTAYIAGFKKAFYDHADSVITMDADLSHNPKVILQMIDKALNYDLIIGSRFIKEGKIIGFDIWRNLLSSTAQTLCRLLLGIKANDSTSGFRLYKKIVIDSVHPETVRSQGYSFLIEILYRCQANGFTIGEIPIIYRVREKGVSKLSRNEIYKAIITVAKLRLGFLLI